LERAIDWIALVPNGQTEALALRAGAIDGPTPRINAPLLHHDFVRYCF